MTQRVLVVDDKELMRDSVTTMLTRAGFAASSAPDAKTAIRMIAQRRPDAVITDLQMPEMNGLELLREVRKIDEQIPVVFMTAFATVETAVQAMKEGAFDYLMKPFEGDRLVTTATRAVEHARLSRENAVLRANLDTTTRRAAPNGPVLVGRSTGIQAVREQIARYAPSQGTVLVTGESGVGKEVVAQLIHRQSRRASAPMLTLNCAALSSSLLESELFGHEKGAFTGADRLRKGRFELADGGTLLLDEISEIPTPVQAKLLRVLQEHAFERVGSSVTQKTDVRVIATTNRRLMEAVTAGTFRQDLFFRLNVLPIAIPPLRHRLDDVQSLCAHFLEIIAKREGQPVRSFSDEAIALLEAYHWPGNVRELFNVCERAAILAQQPVIQAELICNWFAHHMHPGLATPHSNGHDRQLHRSTTDRPRVAADGHGAAPDRTPEIAVAPPGPTRRAAPAHAAPDVASGSEPDDLLAPGHAPGAGFNGVHKLDDEERLDPSEAVRFVDRPLEEVEREVIVATLERNQGHRQRTARQLGIGVRTLGLKLRKWKDLALVAADL